MILLARFEKLLFCLPICDVAEVLRPLPIEPLSELPIFIKGISIIREVPVPVIDMGLLFGISSTQSPSRLIVLNLPERRVALTADEVIGIKEIEPTFLQDALPILGKVRSEIVSAIGVMDSRLLVTLKGGHIVSEEVWNKININFMAQRNLT